MEEEKFTAYDLEPENPIPEKHGEPNPPQTEANPPETEANPTETETKPTETEANPTETEATPTDTPEAQIAKMLKEMGAEKMLDIIRDNRNSAIRQIMSEIDSGSGESLQSGVSVASRCTSIFDLAALA